MTEEKAHETIDRIEKIAEDKRTPAEKGQLTRAQNALIQDLAQGDAPSDSDPIPTGIYAKLAWIQNEVTHVEKTGYNDFNNYAYMQEHGLLELLKPLFNAAGVVFYVRQATLDRNGNHSFLQVEYVLRDLVSNETIGFSLPAEANDKQDKATSKALTNSMKYALQKIFLVPTEAIEDSDREEQGVNSTATSKSSRAGAQSPRVTELTAKGVALIQEGKLSANAIKAHIQAEFAVDSLDQIPVDKLGDFDAWLDSKA